MVTALLVLVVMRCTTRPRYLASGPASLATLRRLRATVLDVVSHSAFPCATRWTLAFKVRMCTMVEMAHHDRHAVAWTVDKGRALHLCLDASDSDVLLHVVLHEVAHMATSDVGHTPEFYRCHRVLLDAAHDRGHYTPPTAKRVSFCGTAVEM